MVENNNNKYYLLNRATGETSISPGYKRTIVEQEIALVEYNPETQESKELVVVPANSGGRRYSFLPGLRDNDDQGFKKGKSGVADNLGDFTGLANAAYAFTEDSITDIAMTDDMPQGYKAARGEGFYIRMVSPDYIERGLEEHELHNKGAFGIHVDGPNARSVEGDGTSGCPGVCKGESTVNGVTKYRNAEQNAEVLVDALRDIPTHLRPRETYVLKEASAIFGFGEVVGKAMSDDKSLDLTPEVLRTAIAKAAIGAAQKPGTLSSDPQIKAIQAKIGIKNNDGKAGQDTLFAATAALQAIERSGKLEESDLKLIAKYEKAPKSEKEGLMVALADSAPKQSEKLPEPVEQKPKKPVFFADDSRISTEGKPVFFADDAKIATEEKPFVDNNPATEAAANNEPEFNYAVPGTPETYQANLTPEQEKLYATAENIPLPNRSKIDGTLSNNQIMSRMVDLYEKYQNTHDRDVAFINEFGHATGHDTGANKVFDGEQYSEIEINLPRMEMASAAADSRGFAVRFGYEHLVETLKEKVESGSNTFPSFSFRDRPQKTGKIASEYDDKAVTVSYHSNQYDGELSMAGAELLIPKNQYPTQSNPKGDVSYQAGLHIRDALRERGVQIERDASDYGDRGVAKGEGVVWRERGPQNYADRGNAFVLFESGFMGNSKENHDIEQLISSEEQVKSAFALVEGVESFAVSQGWKQQGTGQELALRDLEQATISTLQSRGPFNDVLPSTDPTKPSLDNPQYLASLNQAVHHSGDAYSSKVKEFQKIAGLKDDGISGDATRFAHKTFVHEVNQHGEVKPNSVATAKEFEKLGKWAGSERSALIASADWYPSNNTETAQSELLADLPFRTSGGADVEGLTDKTKMGLLRLSRDYETKTGEELRITSGYRGPEKQAFAMKQNMDRDGAGWVGIYRDKTQANEVKRAYTKGGSDEEVLARMTDVLAKYQDKGRSMSSHMSGKKFDIATSDLESKSTLRTLAKQHGFRWLDEGNHIDLGMTDNSPQRQMSMDAAYTAVLSGKNNTLSPSQMLASVDISVDLNPVSSGVMLASNTPEPAIIPTVETPAQTPTQDELPKQTEAPVKTFNVALKAPSKEVAAPKPEILIGDNTQEQLKAAFDTAMSKVALEEERAAEQKQSAARSFKAAPAMDQRLVELAQKLEAQKGVVLYKGAQDDDPSLGRKIGVVQTAYKELGYEIGNTRPDEDFGKGTEEGTYKLQSDLGLAKKDYYVGDDTREGLRYAILAKAAGVEKPIEVAKQYAKNFEKTGVDQAAELLNDKTVVASLQPKQAAIALAASEAVAPTADKETQAKAETEEKKTASAKPKDSEEKEIASAEPKDSVEKKTTSIEPEEKPIPVNIGEDIAKRALAAMKPKSEEKADEKPEENKLPSTIARPTELADATPKDPSAKGQAALGT